MKRTVYLYGGWCPNINGLNYLPPNFEKTYRTTWADVPEDKGEKINITIYTGSDSLIKNIKFGLEESFFGLGTLEWDEKGLFLLELKFALDWNFQCEEPVEIRDQKIIKVLARRVYSEIKFFHHKHIHHSDEEDSLLDLCFLGNERGTHSLTKESTRASIVKHVYEEYRKKHSYYTKHAMDVLSEDPSMSELESAIQYLYKGIGEMTFGIAFLGMYGPIIFTEKELGEEHIKFESAMRSLEALKGKYTFEFMKRSRSLSEQRVMDYIKRINECISTLINVLGPSSVT